MIESFTGPDIERSFRRERVRRLTADSFRVMLRKLVMVDSADLRDFLEPVEFSLYRLAGGMSVALRRINEIVHGRRCRRGSADEMLQRTGHRMRPIVTHGLLPE